MKTETPELVGSLATLSEIYPENSATARRYLRSTIEGSGVKINEEFLKAADTVIQVRRAAAGGLPRGRTGARVGCADPPTLRTPPPPNPAQVLDVVQADLDALSSCCGEMTAALSSSQGSAAQLVHETERLQQALAASEARSKLVGRFLEEYQLTPEEAQALQARPLLGWSGPAAGRVRRRALACPPARLARPPCLAWSPAARVDSPR